MAEHPPDRHGAWTEWGRTLLWLTLLLVPVVFSSRTTEGFELPKRLVLRAAAVVLLAGAVGRAIVGIRLRGPAARVGGLFGFPDPVAAGVVACLLAAAASTAAALSPRTSVLGAEGSFAGLLAVAATATLYFAFRSLCPDVASARTALGGAVAGLGVSVAYALVQFAGLDPLRWEAPVTYEGISRVFSTQGHPNSLAQFLATALPLAVYSLHHAIRRRRTAEALALAFVTAGAAATGFLTLSRAGVLAFAAALAVLGAGVLALPGVDRRWRAVTPAVLGLLLAGGGGLALLADTSGRGLRGLAGRLVNVHALIEGEPRRFLWEAGWQAFRDRPLLGVGVDGFSLAYGRYRTAASWRAEWGETPLKVHNEPLDVLATRGLAGGAAAAILVFGLVRAATRARRRVDGDPMLAVAAAAGLAAYAVHTLFHFPTAAGSALAACQAAALTRLAEAAPPGSPPAPEHAARASLASLASLAAAFVLGAGLLHFAVLRPLRADVFGRAAAVALRTDPVRALALARASVHDDPSRALLWQRLSAACQSAARAEEGPARAALFEEARRAAESAVALVPLSAYAHAHRGTVLSDLERERPPQARRGEVERAFERARALDPVNTDVLVAAASAALAAGDAARAIAWASTCTRHYPAFAPPRALLGSALLAEARRLASSGQDAVAREKRREAASLLRAALAAEWRGDLVGRAAAEANLRSALEGPAGGD